MSLDLTASEMATSIASSDRHGGRWTARCVDAFMPAGSKDLDDLAWPVTTGDCAILIAVSIAAMVSIGTLAAWILENIVSIP